MKRLLGLLLVLTTCSAHSEQAEWRAEFASKVDGRISALPLQKASHHAAKQWDQLLAVNVNAVEPLSKRRASRLWQASQQAERCLDLALQAYPNQPNAYFLYFNDVERVKVKVAIESDLKRIIGDQGEPALAPVCSEVLTPAELVQVKRSV